MMQFCLHAETNVSLHQDQAVEEMLTYARVLKNNGFSNEEIIQKCIERVTLESDEQSSSTLSTTTKKMMAAAALVVSVAVVGGIAYWMKKKSDSKKNAANKKISKTSGGVQNSSLSQSNEYCVNGVTFIVVQGNIQDQHFSDDSKSAIVNAANERLLGGSGVDGAIHAAAGKDLKTYCSKLKADDYGCRCLPGQAIITPGFNLAPRRIIHAVAPRATSDPHWRETLAATYAGCMEVADDNDVQAIAFPALGTGVFGCDPKTSPQIAFDSVYDYLHNNPESSVTEVRFVCWGNDVTQSYNDVLTNEQECYEE